ncbi:hypothetical protein [Clostridium sp. YIM B02555]|uniref:flavodoxin family protein n=1 Tax=Clostridium sp. YIM B02555 TaxID=2911968 RepID=UPI001EEF2B79|nr:hypothetical protein [Clostridium sp. YIM B02555]
MSEKTLVLYHSVQGNTEKVAKILSDELSCNIIKINGKDNASQLTAIKIIRHIAQGRQFKSRIKEIDFSQYNRIYVGGPCWNYTYTPAIGQFLKEADYKNKEIIFFITHRGDFGKSFEKFKAAMAGGKFIGNMDFYKVKEMQNDEVRKKVKEQLNKLKLI